MTASNEQFFEGFSWAVPVNFSDALSRCRFEKGDLLYDTPDAYQKWEDALKCIHYSIQVKSPAQGFGRATDEAGVFEESWKSEVVFTLTDYRTKETREVTTTQGRLFMLLWKGDWEFLNPQKEAPAPLTCFSLTRRCESVASDVKKRFAIAHKMEKPNFWIMAYDPTHFVSRTKYEEISKCFRQEFQVAEEMFNPAELGLAGLLIVPTVKFACFAIDLGASSKISDALKKILYKPSKDRKTDVDRFKLSTHGAFIPSHVQNLDIRGI